MKAWLLNLDNDGALGCPYPNYTPSVRARQLENDLAQLPRLWMEDADCVVTSGSTVANNYCVPMPWGWSHDARKRFLKAGIAEECLPTVSDIERIKQLSHRASTVEINAILKEKYGFDIPSEPRILHSLAEFDPLVESGMPLIAKRPWSGSSRGVFPLTTLEPSEARRLVGGIIRRQGAVEIERMLPKVADFSMLFMSVRGEGVRFLGMGLFYAASDGRYEGNLIASQSIIRSLTGIPARSLDRLASALREIIDMIVSPYYEGYLGIDMLSYRTEDGSTALCPCIEMNLRMTMGTVALLLHRGIGAEALPYLLRVEAAATPCHTASILLAGGPHWRFVAAPATDLLSSKGPI